MCKTDRYLYIRVYKIDTYVYIPLYTHIYKYIEICVQSQSKQNQMWILCGRQEFSLTSPFACHIYVVFYLYFRQSTNSDQFMLKCPTNNKNR